MSATTTTKKTPKGPKTAKHAAEAPAETKSNPEGKSEPAPKAKKPKAEKPAKVKKLSAIDAAAQVLAGAKEPMNCSALIEAMAVKKLWTSPGGKTPQATLYSAILREIATKGKESRFKKVSKGHFAAKE